METFRLDLWARVQMVAETQGWNPGAEAAAVRSG